MKYLLILIIMFIPSLSYAPEITYPALNYSQESIDIIMPSPIHFDPILNAFMEQESNSDQFAYRKSEDACGILQIRQVMIDEANRISGCEKYRLIDAWDVKKSIEIWYLVMKDRNPEYSIKKAVTIWQGKFVKSYYKSILNKIKRS